MSALIFVALAVAWAVYLIPKALKHHEIDRATRPVDSFSDRMRVLARREAVSAEEAALVVERRTPAPAADATGPAADDTDTDTGTGTDTDTGTTETDTDTDTGTTDTGTTEVVAVTLSPAQRRARRAAAARAAKRRRRVLGLLLLVNLAVVGVAVAGVLGWPWVAAPGALLVAWLVACRLMVRRERATRPATVRVRKRRTTIADVVLAEEDDIDSADGTEEVPVVAAEQPEAGRPDGWDPVPVTLPTYVAKAPAGRSVRTIDLDATGVWSSGRNATDSALAREAEQQRAAQTDAAEQRRVSGA